MWNNREKKSFFFFLNIFFIKGRIKLRKEKVENKWIM